jgi:hypothetical protein
MFGGPDLVETIGRLLGNGEVRVERQEVSFESWLDVSLISPDLRS